MKNEESIRQPANLSSQDRLISLAQAAKISGYAKDYLGQLIRQGKLKGRRVGNQWVTTEKWIREYQKILAVGSSQPINKSLSTSQPRDSLFSPPGAGKYAYSLIVILITALFITSPVARAEFGNFAKQIFDPIQQVGKNFVESAVEISERSSSSLKYVAKKFSSSAEEIIQPARITNLVSNVRTKSLKSETRNVSKNSEQEKGVFQVSGSKFPAKAQITDRPLVQFFESFFEKITSPDRITNLFTNIQIPKTEFSIPTFGITKTKPTPGVAEETPGVKEGVSKLRPPKLSDIIPGFGKEIIVETERVIEEKETVVERPFPVPETKVVEKQTIIERLQPQIIREVVSGITPEQLTAQLANVKVDLESQLQNLRVLTSSRSTAIERTVQLTQVIDTLDNITVRDGLTVSNEGLTVTAGGLTVTAGGITVSSGGANITGSLTVGGITVVSGGSINVGDKIVSQGELGIGTTTPGGKFALQATTAGTTTMLFYGIASQTAPLLSIWDNPTSNTNLLTFTAAGRLGIGTTSPSTRFHVSGGAGAFAISNSVVIAVPGGGSATVITLNNNDTTNGNTAGLKFETADGTGAAYAAIEAIYTDRTAASEDGELTFTTIGGGTRGERMRITSTGNVGIGTTSPWGLLSVNPNGITGPSFVVGSSTATNFIINNSGNVGIGTAGPNRSGILSGSKILTIEGGGTFATSKIELLSPTVSGNEIGSITFGRIAGLGGAYTARADIIATSMDGNDDSSLEFYTTDAGTNVQRMRILNTGNVGIGTTSPWGLLSVNPNGIAGPAFAIGSSTQCVTGDTKLKRRRRRRGKDDSEEDVFEDVRIDEIKEGDEILTMDEKTGTLVVSMVKKLMRMGVKPIVKITTALGRTIRTTAEHPYLAKTASSDLPPKKPMAGIFIDNANLFYAERQAGWKIDLRKLRESISESFDVKFVNYYHALPDRNDPSYAPTARFLESIKDIVAVKTKPLKYVEIAKGKYEKKGDTDVEIALDVVRSVDALDLIIVVTGDSDFAALRDYVLYEKQKKIVFVGFKHNLAWELKSGKYAEFEKFRTSLKLGVDNKTTPEPKLGRTLVSLLYSRPPSLSSGGVWTKVRALKEGKEIAVLGKNKKPVWDKIVKIEHLSEEQVYDIEVEGTHNFIGNDIVAHNTYFTVTNAGNVGIGTTAPGAKLEIETTSGDASLHLDAQGTGDAPAIRFQRVGANKWGLISDDATDRFRIYDFTNNLERVSILTSGNVGIGTTTPNWLLQVNGTRPSFALSDSSAGTDNKHWLLSSMGGNLYVGTTTDAYATSTPAAFTILNNGNVGIGTTSPGDKLEIVGTAINLRSPDSTYAFIKFYPNSGNAGSWEMGNSINDKRFFLYDNGLNGGDGSGWVWLVYHKPANGTGQNYGMEFKPSFSNLNTAGDAYTGLLLDVTDAQAGATGNKFIQDWRVGGASKMAITNTGNVGIGTTTPNWLLQTAGTRPLFVLSDTSAGTDLKHKFISSQGGFLYIGDATDAYATTTRLTIDSSGNVGIGTTSPAQLLSVAGNSYLTGGLGIGQTETTAGNITGTGRLSITSTTATSTFSTGGLTVGTSQFVVQQNSGNVGIGTTTPGVKLDVVGSDNILRIASGATNVVIFADSGMLSQAGAGGPNVMYYQNYNAGAPAYTFASDTDTGMWRSAANQLAFSTNATDRMTIDPNGNVGIGTTSPNWLLQVNGTRPSFALSDSSAGTNNKHWLFSSMGGNLYVGTTTDAYATSTPAALTILNNGNVGIGTANPGSNLDIYSDYTKDAVLRLTGGPLPDFNSQIYLRSSRGTVSSPTAAANGDNLGWLQWTGYDGTSFVGAAEIDTYIDGAVSGGIVPGAMAFFTRDTSGSYGERMRITNSGNVGIGTTSPWGLLSVNPNGITGPAFTIGSSTQTHFLVDNAGNVQVGTSTSNLTSSAVKGLVTITGRSATLNALNLETTVSGYVDLGFSIGSSNKTGIIRHLYEGPDSKRGFAFFGMDRNADVRELVRFTMNNGLTPSNPRVGIGTTSPSNILHLSSQNTTDAAITFTSTSSTDVFDWSAGVDFSDGGKFKIASSTALGTSDRFVIDGSGNVGIGTTSPWRTFSVNGTVAFPALTNNQGGGVYVCALSSGEVATSSTACGSSSFRFKENVEPISYGLDAVLNLRPVSFQYNEEYGFYDLGTQVGFIAEEVAEIIPEVVGYHNGLVQSVDYPKLTAVLVKAVQDLAASKGQLSTENGPWSVLETGGKVNITFFGSLNMSGNDILEVRKILGYNNMFSLDETGKLVVKDIEAENIRTNRFCIEDVCITKTEFEALLKNAGILQTPAPQTDSLNSPSSTDTTTATTTPDSTSSPSSTETTATSTPEN